LEHGSAAYRLSFPRVCRAFKRSLAMDDLLGPHRASIIEFTYALTVSAKALKISLMSAADCRYRTRKQPFGLTTHACYNRVTGVSHSGGDDPDITLPAMRFIPCNS
jgi:hypothetical protein